EREPSPLAIPGHRGADLLPRSPHQPADLRRPPRYQLAPGRLRGARRLQGAAQDHRRRPDPGPGDRHRQGIGLARPRRCGLPHRPEVELHAAPVPRPEVPGVQLRRRRAGHVQGP
ncbi:MAG: NADH-ubiquinone oxidoreductase chain F, partial [uncultured Ramlibacter sp.]